jgi:hypothetical protein
MIMYAIYKLASEIFLFPMLYASLEGNDQA